MSDGIHKRATPGHDVEKTDLGGYDGPGDGYTKENIGGDQHIRGIETNPETMLHRGLKARHITMIAIGGAVGKWNK